MKSLVHTLKKEKNLLKSNTESTKENQQEKRDTNLPVKQLYFIRTAGVFFHFIKNISVPNLSYISHHSKYEVLLFFYIQTPQFSK